MAEIRLNIDGRELKGNDSQSILDIARASGIDIPTLCHDERVKSYGSCGLCLVEAENSPRLLRACSTAAANGMIIKTNTARVREARKAALELLLSDHTGDCRPPCAIACPGNTDCQGYVGLIANGQYKEALALIKDIIPLAASIGRVCPHPCEEACRRELVEEPVAIAHLKAFAADMDMLSESPFTPDVKPDTGKRVAIIGGGPGGLTAAYFLRVNGHSVTVYDAMPKMGGMLRYGIPEYRLPKAVLDAEISMIEKLGVNMVNGIRIGEDLTFEYIRKNYDAALVATGAWVSMGLGCPGEELSGVVGGIDFLRAAAINAPLLAGKRVAVVGGGNTAMDACRTAVRLGADEVYNVYRRTRAEMPAEDIEIAEAEEEGVIFKFLANPIEVAGKDGKVSKIRLQKMELGEPDASGRRAPVPIPGAEEVINVDTVIPAIGQRVNPAGFEALGLTKRGTIAADEFSYMTNVQGVFAVGDATNKGASIAIEAIGEAKRAAGVIDGYLNGAATPFSEPFVVKQEVTAEKFADRQKAAREKMRHVKPEERRRNFAQVNLGFTEEQAKAEASRCLECGCADYFECKLIKYANDYDVRPEKYDGEKHERPHDTSNPFIYRNPDKCILCGLCVRVCDEVMGRTALGLVGRGFDTIVKPELELPLAQTDCISCGQCAALCPTGALGEILPLSKPVPVVEEVTHSVCSYCGVGCETRTTTKGRAILRSLPGGDTDLLCVKGRFGPGEFQKQARVTKPLIRKDGRLTEVSPDEALMLVTKKTQGVSAVHGAGSVAVAMSDKLTNEEIFLLSRYANEVLNTNNVFSLGGVKSGLKAVLGADASANTLDELAGTDVIVLVCEDIINSHTIAGIHIKRAVENGAKLILISNGATQADEWAQVKLSPGSKLDTLKEMAKALIDAGYEPKNAHGFDGLKTAFAGVTAGSAAKEAAELYGKAKKAIIVFDKNALTADAATLLADIAVISGHIGTPRNGIIQLTANCNSQGLADMGVNTDGEALVSAIEDRRIKALLIFGEDAPSLPFTDIEFVMVADSIMTETAEMADVVLPLAASVESNGTYTSADRRLHRLQAALPSALGLDNIKIIQKLANVSADTLRYETAMRILADVGRAFPAYSGADRADFSAPVYVPVGKSPVLYTDGFTTDDGMALLKPPAGDAMFRTRENTHAVYRRFMNYLDSKGLIRQ